MRNLERWLVQVDVPGAVAHRTKADVHRADPTPENGTAYEGLSTAVAKGDKGLAFRADPAFLGAGPHDVVVKVTYLDQGKGGFTVVAPGSSSAVVPRRDDGRWKTATVLLPQVVLDRSLAAKTDLRLVLSSGPATSSCASSVSSAPTRQAEHRPTKENPVPLGPHRPRRRCCGSGGPCCRRLQRDHPRARRGDRRGRRAGRPPGDPAGQRERGALPRRPARPPIAAAARGGRRGVTVDVALHLDHVDDAALAAPGAPARGSAR